MPASPNRKRGWRLLVPLVCLGAGYLFAVSAHDAAGGRLRPPGIAGLRESVIEAEKQVRAADQQVSGLQRRVDATAARIGHGNAVVASARRHKAQLEAPAGLRSMRGPGLEVVLDDAPTSDLTTGVDPNQLVVHQSDLQAVVNALWAGGAEAVSIAGQRLIATSAVRCVGNTLLLNGEVFSPPFRVMAIGPSGTMQQRLDASPGVQLFRQAAQYYGLGYTVATVPQASVPGYRGPIELRYARAGR